MGGERLSATSGSPALNSSRQLAAEAPLVFFSELAVVLDGARQVLAPQDWERLALGLEPVEGGEREPVEDGAADEGGRRPGHYAVAHLDDRVAGNAAVVEHVVGDLEKPF